MTLSSLNLGRPFLADHLACSAGSQPLKNKKGGFHCDSEKDCVGKDVYCAVGAGTGLCCSKKVRGKAWTFLPINKKGIYKISTRNASKIVVNDTTFISNPFSFIKANHIARRVNFR